MNKFTSSLLTGVLLTLGSVGFAQTTPAPKAKSTVTDKDLKSDLKKVPADSKMSGHPIAAPVDINTATIDKLKAVPGIGDAYAAKIIAGRPYKNKSQLKSRGILPAGVYAKVSANLIAKQ